MSNPVYRLYLSPILGLTLFLLGIAVPVSAQPGPEAAQPMLTLDQAIAIGLEHNFAIRIARNEAGIAENNNTLGNAGFLPNLSVTANRTKRIEDSRSEFTGNIPPNDTDGAETISRTAAASLDWTIFDGMTMFVTREKLSELKALGKTESRLAVENTLSQIITAYFNIVRQHKSLQVLESTLEVSEQRIQIAETKKDLGSGSEYDLLQARADYNADRAAVIRQKVQLNTGKVLLNELLGRDPDTGFQVQPEITLAEQMEFETVRQRTLKNNLNLALARTNRRVSELEIKEIRGERFPEISLNLGYGLSETESNAGFLQLNRSSGLNYGISARIDLFDGFNINRRQENAEIRLKNQELEVEEIQNRILANLSNIYTSYLNSLSLVELEEENLTYSRQSLEIALERFKLGTIDSIELREAQRTLINAENRLIQARYEAKVAETELLRLSSMITTSRE